MQSRRKNEFDRQTDGGTLSLLELLISAKVNYMNIFRNIRETYSGLLVYERLFAAMF